MKTKVSKAQKEVWEWKQKAYEELKEIPEDKRVDYIREKVREVINRIKKNRQKRSAA